MSEEVIKGKYFCETRGMNAVGKDGQFRCRYRGGEGQTDIRGDSLKGKCLYGISMVDSNSRTPHIENLPSCLFVEEATK